MSARSALAVVAQAGIASLRTCSCCRTASAGAPQDAGRWRAADGRIPLDHYRGRTLDSPRAQAAEAHVRRMLGLDRIADVRPVGDDGTIAEFETPDGIVRVRVDEEEGPVVPVSCGAGPEPTTRLVTVVQ
jgi:hypothetical protein